MTQHPHPCQQCPLGISGHQVQQACSSYLVQEPPGDTKVKAPSPVIRIPRVFSVPLLRPDQLRGFSHGSWSKASPLVATDKSSMSCYASWDSQPLTPHTCSQGWLQGQAIHLFSSYKGYNPVSQGAQFLIFLLVRNSEAASSESLWDLAGWRERDKTTMHDSGTKCKTLFISGHISFA